MMLLNPAISLRPVSEADLPFLQQVYASVREEELRPTGWSAAEKQAFIAMQFQAQHQAYFRYENAEYFVVLQHQQAIGRIYLQHQPQAILIIDVALLAHARAQGIGTGLLQATIAQARAVQKSVLIHVEKFNPALRLYQRLGFELRQDKGVYLLLEKPYSAASVSASEQAEAVE